MKYYEQSELARLLQVPRMTIWRWCKAGKIQTTIHEVIRNGRTVHIPLITESEAKRLRKLV